jgi:hypothetical protein
MSLGWVAMQAGLPPMTASERDTPHVADRAAAAARPALVAGLRGVVEVGAARTLQQVAGGGGAVAQLAGGAGQQRAGQHGVVALHGGIRGQVAVAHQRADAQAAIARCLDAVQAQRIDVDEMGGRLDLQLHQVQQIGAPGDEARIGALRDRGGGLGRRAGALEAEGFHAAPPATRVIASAMLE